MKIYKLYEKLLDFKPFWVVALIANFFLIPFYIIWLLIQHLIVPLRSQDYWEFKDFISDLKKTE